MTDPRDPHTRIRIIRDDTCAGFGGWCVDSWKRGDPKILLNVSLLMSHLCDYDGNPEDLTPAERKRTIVETLMHEFGHALEDWMDLEFDEDAIEACVQEYGKRYPIGG